MKKIFEIFIPVKPKPKQSVRIGRYGMYQPKEIVQYIKDISTKLQENFNSEILDCPVGLEIIFYYPLRKKDKKPNLHTNRPDIENLVKPVMDSMKKIIFSDDSLVCYLKLLKLRAKKTGIKIKVFKLTKD